MRGILAETNLRKHLVRDIKSATCKERLQFELSVFQAGYWHMNRVSGGINGKALCEFLKVFKILLCALVLHLIMLKEDSQGFPVHSLSGKIWRWPNLCTMDESDFFLRPIFPLKNSFK